mgnify:CR=1 FL=1
MTEAEKEYLQEWRNNWIDNKVKGLRLEDQNWFVQSNYELELMQSFAAEQVKKALEEVEKSLQPLIKESLWEDEKVYKGKQDQRNKTQEAINELREK